MLAGGDLSVPPVDERPRGVNLETGGGASARAADMLIKGDYQKRAEPSWLKLHNTKLCTSGSGCHPPTHHLC